MSPIYDFQCGLCGEKREVYKSFSSEAPLCCGEPMDILPSAPAKINVKGTHSKGYKEGYAKEYRRRLQDERGKPIPAETSINN